MNPNLNPNQNLNQPITQPQANAPLPVQTLASPTEINCGKCKKPLSEFSYFCPNCGNKIVDKPFKLTLKTITYVMIMSIIFPPLGIFPGLKYLRYKETSAKILGLFAILVTLFFTFLMFYVFMNFMNNMSRVYTNIYNPNGDTNSSSQSIQDQINILRELYQ